jgi:hypothetical protein
MVRLFQRLYNWYFGAILPPSTLMGWRMSDELNGFADAVKQAGGQVVLAGRLGVTQQAVSQWLRRGWVPVRRAVEVEQATGIPRQRLVNPRLRELVGSDDSGV